MYTGNLKRATIESAGYDISSSSEYVIQPGKRVLVATGVRLGLNSGTFGLLKSRSGLACKGIDVGAGVIDSDYSNEVKVLLINNSEEPFVVEIGMRVAQLIILPILEIQPGESVAKKNHEGFGSTGLF